MIPKTSREKPVAASTGWASPIAEMSQDAGGVVQGQAVSRSGGHYIQEFVNRKKAEYQEDQARALRNYGGRDRDARKIPPSEYQTSSRTYKSSSRIRFPSEQFRTNYALIDWSQ